MAVWLFSSAGRGGFEQVITEDVPLDAIVRQVMNDNGLSREDPLPDPRARQG